ncbi:MAG: TetR/AcrR family transcriptional regulator [Pseudomonadota bacterium]
MSTKREELQTVASEAVRSSGLHSLSFRTLAHAAGIKSSSVHYYFPEKSDLASALIDQYIQEFRHRLEAIDADAGDPKNRFLRFAGIFEEALENDRLCLCGMLAAESSDLNDENKAKLTDFFNLAEDWLVGVFKDHSGSHNNEIDAIKLARTAIAGLQGAILIDRPNRERRSIEALKTTVLGLLH